jgi:hypothetical protein
MPSPVTDLFVRPGRFFASRAPDPGRLGPVAIVALTGTITLGGQLLLVSMSVIGQVPTIEYVTQSVRVSLPALSVAGAVISFGHVFAYWLVYSLVFYLVTIPFAEEGSPSTLFWLAGWGFLPWFLAGLVWLVAMVLSAGMIPEPVVPAENVAFVRQVQDTLLVRATRPIETLGVVWSLGLWTVLVRRVRGVDLWQAALAVFPVAAFEAAKIFLLL